MFSLFILKKKMKKSVLKRALRVWLGKHLIRSVWVRTTDLTSCPGHLLVRTEGEGNGGMKKGYLIFWILQDWLIELLSYRHAQFFKTMEE